MSNLQNDFTAYAALRHPVTYALLVLFAALGGFKLYRDIMALVDGSISFGDIGTDYMAAIVAAVTLLFLGRRKAKRQAGQS